MSGIKIDGEKVGDVDNHIITGWTKLLSLEQASCIYYINSI